MINLARHNYGDFFQAKTQNGFIKNEHDCCVFSMLLFRVLSKPAKD